jgi:hypothetical protein
MVCIHVIGADANRPFAGSIHSVMSDPKLPLSMRTTLSSIASLSVARMVISLLSYHVSYVAPENDTIRCYVTNIGIRETKRLDRSVINAERISERM